MMAARPHFILVRLGRVRFQGLSQGGADILRICTDYEIFFVLFWKIDHIRPTRLCSLQSKGRGIDKSPSHLVAL